MSMPISSEQKFEWDQNSLRFAITDFRRNWHRWLFWAALYVAAIALFAFFTGPNPHPRYTPPDPRIFWPVIYVGVVGFQFLSAAFLWDVEVGDDRIKLGYGRNARYYRFKKIAHVGFDDSPESPSMLLEFRSGKRVEVFIDIERVQISDLKRYFTSTGISVGEGIL